MYKFFSFKAWLLREPSSLATSYAIRRDQSVHSILQGTITVTSRSSEERDAMFGFEPGVIEEILKEGKQVVVLPGGACGWTPQPALKGMIYADPVYGEDISRMKTKINQEFESWVAIATAANQKSGYFGTQQDLQKIIDERRTSKEAFLEQMAAQPENYINDAFPKIPKLRAMFGAQKAELVLSSFLLFFYDLGLCTPMDAIQDMLAIGKEVRIHPLYDQNRQQHKDVDDIKEALERQGYKVELRDSAYSAVKNAYNKTMVITGGPE